MATRPIPEVDPKLLREFRLRLQERSRHPRRLIATAFIRQGIVAVLVLFLVLPLVIGQPLFDGTLTGRMVLILGTAVVAMASLAAFLTYRRTRDTLAIGLAEHQRLLEADWKRWASAGWVGRTIMMGGLITAGVGLPIGILVAVTLPVGELPFGSRVLMFFLFVVLTALWAFPTAFAIRWYALRDYKTLAPSSSGN